MVKNHSHHTRNKLCPFCKENTCSTDKAHLMGKAVRLRNPEIRSGKKKSTIDFCREPEGNIIKNSGFPLGYFEKNLLCKSCDALISSLERQVFPQISMTVDQIPPFRKIYSKRLNLPVFLERETSAYYIALGIVKTHFLNEAPRILVNLCPFIVKQWMASVILRHYYAEKQSPKCHHFGLYPRLSPEAVEYLKSILMTEDFEDTNLNYTSHFRYLHDLKYVLEYQDIQPTLCQYQDYTKIYFMVGEYAFIQFLRASSISEIKRVLKEEPDCILGKNSEWSTCYPTNSKPFEYVIEKDVLNAKRCNTLEKRRKSRVILKS